MQDYLSQLQLALTQESEWSHKEHVIQENLPFEDRVAIGISWPSITMTSFSDIYRRRMDIDFRQTKGAPLHDGIQPGDLISITPLKRGGDILFGICRDVYLESCTIQLRDLKKGFTIPKWLQFGSVVITLRFDPSTFIQYKKGLDRAKEHHSTLKSSLLQPWEGNEHQEPKPNWWKGLNISQQIAAQTTVEAKDIAVIHGPPGTGKTHTLTRIIQHLLKQNTRIWAVAASNAAIDHLCQSIADVGIDVLRLGSEFRISKSIWPMSLWYKIENHPQQPALKALEKEIVRASG